jgi:putative ABC transport system permease protein
VLGLGVGAAALGPLLAASPVELDRLAAIGIDGQVLAFTFAIAVASGLLFGIVPALQARRVDLHEPLKQGSTRATGGIRGHRVRKALVIGEVAIALVLVTFAALLVRSFARLTGLDPGFSPQQVLTLKLSVPDSRYGNGAALARFSEQVVERVSRLPRVRAAAAATSLPLEAGPDLPFKIEGKFRSWSESEGVGEAQYRCSSPAYFDALGIHRLSGRDFADTDRHGAPGVAIVNQAAARRFWPKVNPVGQRITIGLPNGELSDPAPRTIVGVVSSVREDGLDKEPPPIIYVPITQLPDSLALLLLRFLPINLVVRADGDPAALTGPVERQVWAVDPRQPVTDVQTLERVVAKSLGTSRFTMSLLGLLAALALLLAAVGIYGLLSHLVLHRTREIGVRMALGATQGDVLRMVVGQGLPAVLTGVACGLGAAFGLTRFLSALLFDITAHDPLTFAITPAVLTAVACVASSIPARRASLLDPLEALGRD